MVKEAGKASLDNSFVLDLLEKEAEESQKLNVLDYLEMVEKVQDMLHALSHEGSVLRQEKADMINRLGKHKEITDQVSRENQILHSKYDEMLTQMDIVNMKMVSTEKERNEAASKLEDLSSNYDKLVKVKLPEADKKIKELQESVDKYSRDNSQLHERLAVMLSSRSSSENIQGLIQLELNEMNSKYKSLLAENEKLRDRLEMILKEKSDLNQQLESRDRDIEKMKRNFKVEIERLVMDQANKLKDLNEERLKERYNNVGAYLNQISEVFTTVEDTQLDNFEFEEHEDSVINMLQAHQSDRHLLKKSNFELLDEIETKNHRHSNKQNDKQVYPVYKEKIDENMGYLEELEQKNKEIANLRNQINELKEKINNAVISDPRLLEEIKKLELDLKHEKETYLMWKENSEREKQQSENISKELETLFVSHKLKNQAEIAKRYEDELNLMRKIKMLKYQIQLYENQIHVFNEKVLRN